MPEFIMENTNEAARTESAFVFGFIEAMFFTENEPGVSAVDWFKPKNLKAREAGTQGGQIPGDVGYCDLHPDALKEIRAFCEDKRAKMADLLELACARDYDEAQAGRDLWFTYNGHGVGYWDRKELEADGLGDALTKRCGRGECHPFFGDHVEHGNAPFVFFECY